MEIRAVVGEFATYEADTMVIYVLEGGLGDAPDNATRVVNDVLDKAIVDLIDSQDVTGKMGEVTVLYPRGAMPVKRIILVGLGNPEKYTIDVARRVVAIGMQKARSLKSDHVATVLLGTGSGGFSNADSAQAIAEGALLGLYQYQGYKSDAKVSASPEKLDIVVLDENDVEAVESGIAAGRAFANGASLARDLINTPPNICNPVYMAIQAQQMADEVGLSCKVLEKRQMWALKMGALLAVAQGSDNEPRFIILEHNADKSDELDTLVLVGKGVTFDTGGYSLKSKDGMVGMKADMGGAAAVIGAMRTVAELDVPLHVVGLVPTADNIVSGTAYRPQDVVTASNGKTIEIISTDAEGRLLLADALVYAKRYDPKAVVDIATLTGGVAVALGTPAAGIFGTDESLIDELRIAGASTHEPLWHMPIFNEYGKPLESDVADTKNSGGQAGRYGSAGVAAYFLRQFVDYPRWAHIDIAGTMRNQADNPYVPGKMSSATGFGSRLLAAWVQQQAASE